MGDKLMLPEQYEQFRGQIERSLLKFEVRELE
jgi:glyoxalase family protein